VLRRRRSKLLPRQFVLAATGERLVAFKALGVGDEDGSWYEARIRPGEEASFPRAGVSLTDLPDGLASESGTLVVGTERIPVLRQAATGDPSTDEPVELLAA
jgi:hypothetical protein